jgi:hypothetical protein
VRNDLELSGLGKMLRLQESGAHQQAPAKNGMYRYKRITGDRLRAKHRESQIREALMAVNVINRMTALGMPNEPRSWRDVER